MSGRHLTGDARELLQRRRPDVVPETSSRLQQAGGLGGSLRSTASDSCASSKASVASMRTRVACSTRNASCFHENGGLPRVGPCRPAGLRPPDSVPLHRVLRGEHGQPRPLQVDERVADVADLAAHDVLELRLQGRPGHAGHDRAGLPLVRHVDGIGDVHVVLCRAARGGVVEGAVGNELAVQIDERIGAQPGRDDVGIGLRQLVPQRPDVDIGRHHPFDRGIEREAVLRSLVVDERCVERADRSRSTGPGQRLGRRLGQRLGRTAARPPIGFVQAERVRPGIRPGRAGTVRSGRIAAVTIAASGSIRRAKSSGGAVLCRRHPSAE